MAATGVPFNQHRAHGTIHPTEPRTAFDGTTVAVSFEQRGLDGVTRMYGPAPDYKRVLTDGQKLEDVDAVKDAVRAKGAAAAQKSAAKKAGAKAAAPQAKATGRFAQMKGGDHTPDRAEGPDADAGPTLAEWAKGDAEIPFAEVQRRIKDEFDADVEDESQAAEALVANGVVEQDDVVVSAVPA